MLHGQSGHFSQLSVKEIFKHGISNKSNLSPFLGKLQSQENSSVSWCCGGVDECCRQGPDSTGHDLSRLCQGVRHPFLPKHVDGGQSLRRETLLSRGILKKSMHAKVTNDHLFMLNHRSLSRRMRPLWCGATLCTAKCSPGLIWQTTRQTATWQSLPQTLRSQELSKKYKPTPTASFHF